MKQAKTTFPRISNDMIESGMRQARVERSKAMYSIVEAIFGRKTRSGRLPGV